MLKNFKTMKAIKISKIKENKPKYNAVEVLVEKGPHQLVDNSFEKLFYNTIDVFAYSRFYEISINSEEFSDPDYIILIKSLYKNFVEKQGLFENHEIKTYQNLVLIIDEFCAEKIKQFFDIMNLHQERSAVDKKINEFVNYNDNIIEAVSEECKKNFNGKYIEYVMKDLQKQNPQKFQELIDFEINKKELKDSSDKVRLVAGDRRVKPSAIFLNEIKKHSNLEKTSLQNKNQRSFCVIS
jgi:hypothetical protein